MFRSEKLQVLSGLRLLLKFTNLYNKNGVCIRSARIPNFFVFCMVLMPAFLFVLLLMWISVEEKFGFQYIIAYISLAMRTDLIVSTVDQLQEHVEKS